MEPRVLIVIDNAKRELFGGTLLARCLGSLGVEAVLCSVFAFRAYYARLAPDAVVWPNPLRDLSEVAADSAVFVLPSESGNGQPDLVAMHGGTAQNPVYPKGVDRFFCWGSAMRQILLEGGAWSDEQLVVTGSPATDHWLLPRREGPGSRIGLTTTFRALSNSATPARTNYFEWLDQAERWGGDGSFYLPPEHAESWVFFEASLARVVVGLARVLTAARAEPLDIRPHPLELEERYRYLSGITGGRASVTKAGTISQWLDDKAILFTFMSASALDAVVRGLPVVSLMNLIDPDALRKIPAHFRYGYEPMLWPLDDAAQAAEYVESAVGGRLDTCRDRRGIEALLADHFAYPRPQPAAARVAAEIKEVLDGAGRRRPRRPRSSRGGWRRGLELACRHLPLAAPTGALARYLYGLAPGHADTGFSYRPWALGERRAAARCAEQVLRGRDGHRDPGRRNR